MDVKQEVTKLADRYAAEMQRQIAARRQALQVDDTSHYLVYQVLGLSLTDGEAIDLYQNIGRFLYTYAGKLIERATQLCFQASFPEAKAATVPNPSGKRPKTFGIDCLLAGDAYEIKWRDATTDGDHILKERDRIWAVAAAGYRPIRLMYYYPNRTQARKVQAAIAEAYAAVGGLYYSEQNAWQHVKERTGTDLKAIFEEIVNGRAV